MIPYGKWYTGRYPDSLFKKHVRIILDEKEPFAADGDDSAYRWRTQELEQDGHGIKKCYILTYRDGIVSTFNSAGNSQYYVVKQRIYNAHQKRMEHSEEGISTEREQGLFNQKQWEKDRRKKFRGVWRGIGYVFVFFSVVMHFGSSDFFVDYSWSELFTFLMAAGVPLILGWHLQLREMPTFWTIYCLIVFGVVIYHLFQIMKREIWDIGIVIVCAVVFVLIWGFVFGKQTKNMEIELRRLFTVKKDVWGERFIALDLKEKKMYMVYHRFEDESDDNPSEKYGFQEITEEQMRRLARECNVKLEKM